jgi:hypothetical protein
VQTIVQTAEVLYLFKRCGIYYFSRRVPLDIQGEYSTKRISFSLRTRNKRTALLGASHLASELDSHWSGIRIRKMVNKHIHCYTLDSNMTLGRIKQAITYFNLVLNHFRHPLVQYV